MDTIKEIRQKAKSVFKKIVLPEYNDSRVVKAAEIIEKEKIADVFLLTPERIDTCKKEEYIQRYYQIHQGRGIQLEEVRKIFEDPLYYAAMAVREGIFDGLVAGASHTTAEVIRCAIRCIGVNRQIGLVTGIFLMVLSNSNYGENGNFIFADCAAIPEPTAEEFVKISLAIKHFVDQVLKFPVRIAFLSYSTYGSTKTTEAIERIRKAVKSLREKYPDILVDGELQVDAAIVPEVARIKAIDSPLGGRANCLIFPNLEAGNISYKLVQRLADARAIGPILLGLNKPCSDLSRGCSIDDVIDCVAITSLQS